MPRLRLGVALLLPPPVATEIDALRRACGDPALTKVPSHLTLVPPVNVRDDRRGEALDILRTAAAATRPFTLELGPPASFLPVNPVLYLAVGGSGLDALHALRDRAFVDPLARPLTHPFVPHVTVADELAVDRIEAALVALSGYRATVTFERVHLLQEGDGRVWSPIADAPFAAPAVVGRGGLPVELTISEQPDPEARAFSEREWPLFDLKAIGTAEAARTVAITARRDSAVVGLAEGWAKDGQAHLDAIMVAADARGEGIGSHLLARFVSWASEQDCERVTLRSSTPAAHRFYEHRGWTAEAEWPWMGGRTMRQMVRKL